MKTATSGPMIYISNTSIGAGTFNTASLGAGTAVTFEATISVGFNIDRTANNTTAVGGFSTTVPIGFNSTAIIAVNTPNRFESNTTGLAIHNPAIPAGSDPIAAVTISTGDLSVSASTAVGTTIESTAVEICYNPITPSLVGLQTSGTSSFNPAYYERYTDIKQELSHLISAAAEGNPIIEIGAIDTAQIVLNYLMDNHFPPPQVTSMGADAIVMLWTSSDATAAVTITDGELGHIIRRARKTIKRKSNIKPGEFDLLSST